MSQSTAQQQQSSENEEAANASGKAAMSGPGIKGVSTIQRNRIPTNQSARGATQGNLANNALEDGNKSQSNSARRSSAKPSVSPTTYRRPLSSLGPGTATRSENLYISKKKRFLALKKDLMDKQKVAQDLYNDITQLRKKVIASGAKDPGKLDDLKLEVGCPKQPQSVELCVQSEQPDVHVDHPPINKEFLESLETQLHEIPKKSRDLCQELLEKQSALLSFVSSRLTSCRETDESDNVNLEIATQLENHQRELDNVRARLNEMEITEPQVIQELMKNTHGLIEEFENHRVKIKELQAVECQREVQSQLNSVMEELQTERTRSNQSKEQTRQAEAQLQRARTKIRELEIHVTNDEGKIQQLQTNIRSLETQMKQKDQAMENRLKNLQKTMKNSEGLIAKVEKQRDSFESRLVELKEKMCNKEGESMNTVIEISGKLNEITNELGAEKERRQQAEEAYSELKERYKHLEEKSQQLCELAEKNKEFTVTEGSHTENEVSLFNELQATREELKLQKEMILQLQQEKKEIVAVMHQAASHDEDENSREKLTAELVLKSNELQNLMMQYTEMKKVAKNAQERSGTLERQLMEIQTRLQTQSREGGKAGLSAHAIELQQQVSDLRSNLAEAMHQKEELETVLTQKQLELEQRDRVMRDQSKFLKARDELLDILRGKVRENGELSSSDENNEYIDQVHQQIAAKTEAIQELCSTLEKKQVQIMRLEKMVKLMEEHQDRAQQQRTRFENRVAELELALQKIKEQRYVRDMSTLPARSLTLSDEDRLSQDHFSDSDRSSFRQSIDFHSSSYQNRHDSFSKRPVFVSGAIPSQTDHLLHDYENYTPRQSSSDEEQPYICERCRQETKHLERDDENLTNSDERFYTWFTNSSPLPVKIPGNSYHFHENDYIRDSPSIVRDSSSVTYSLHGESDNVDDSSRESQGPYDTDHPRRQPLRHRVWPSNRTDFFETDL